MLHWCGGAIIIIGAFPAVASRNVDPGKEVLYEVIGSALQGCCEEFCDPQHSSFSHTGTAQLHSSVERQGWQCNSGFEPQE